ARRSELAARFGWGALGPDDRLLLFVGRLEVQKDPRLLLETFAAVRSAAKSRIRLVVVGEGSLHAQSIAWARELGVAESTTFVEAMPHQDIAQLMPSFDALLLPSR